MYQVSLRVSFKAALLIVGLLEKELVCYYAQDDVAMLGSWEASVCLNLKPFHLSGGNRLVERMSHRMEL